MNKIIWFLLKLALHVVKDEGIVFVTDSSPGTVYKARRLWIEKNYRGKGKLRAKIDIDELLLKTKPTDLGQTLLMAHECMVHIEGMDMKAKMKA